jgi:hypothetical protein
MLRYTVPISAFVGLLLPLQPAIAAPFPDYTSPVPVQAPPPVPRGDLKPEAAASASEEAVVRATAIVTARLAELEAEIARATRDVAALTSERRDLQERVNALSGQTLEASQRLSKLRGSVPNTENETPVRQHLVPVAQPSTSIGQAKVGG